MTNKTLNIKNSLIQTLFTRPFFTKDEITNLISPFEYTISGFTQEINDQLHTLGFELRQITSDYDNTVYFGICQTCEDASASEALGLKAEQVQLYYKFIEATINSLRENRNALTIGELLDVAPPGMSQAHAQETVRKLCKIGYIIKDGDKLKVGPRGILEFRPTFSQLAGKDDLQKCNMCVDFIICGIRCPNCNSFFHKRCCDSLSQGSWKCPSCKSTEPYVEFGN